MSRVLLGGGKGGAGMEYWELFGGKVDERVVCCTPPAGLSDVVEIIPNLFGSNIPTS